jgi:hypothetical protein
MSNPEGAYALAEDLRNAVTAAKSCVDDLRDLDAAYEMADDIMVSVDHVLDLANALSQKPADRLGRAANGFELAGKDWASRQLEKPEVRQGFDQERASYEFCQQLETALSAEDISRSELTERLGKTKAFITQSLKRGHNLTIKTMSELASACGMELHVLLRRREAVKLTRFDRNVRSEMPTLPVGDDKK